MIRVPYTHLHGIVITRQIHAVSARNELRLSFGRCSAVDWMGVDVHLMTEAYSQCLDLAAGHSLPFSAAHTDIDQICDEFNF